APTTAETQPTETTPTTPTEAEVAVETPAEGQAVPPREGVSVGDEIATERTTLRTPVQESEEVKSEQPQDGSQVTTPRGTYTFQEGIWRTPSGRRASNQEGLTSQFVEESVGEGQQ